MEASGDIRTESAHSTQAGRSVFDATLVNVNTTSADVRWVKGESCIRSIDSQIPSMKELSAFIENRCWCYSPTSQMHAASWPLAWQVAWGPQRTASQGAVIISEKLDSSMDSPYWVSIIGSCELTYAGFFRIPNEVIWTDATEASVNVDAVGIGATGRLCMAAFICVSAL